MVCVVWGHTRTYLCGEMVRDFHIYPAFIPILQMPLFIFISGVFAKSPTSLNDLKMNITKYVKSLLVPYVSWVVLAMICHLLSEIFILHNENITLLLLISNKFGLLWYMGTLLLCHAVYNIYSVILRGQINNFKLLILLGMVFAAGALLPFDYYNFLFLFPFYILGKLMSKIDWQIWVQKKYLRYVMAAFGFLMVVLSYFFPTDYSFYNRSNSILCDNNIIIGGGILIYRYFVYVGISFVALYWIMVACNWVEKSVREFFLAVGKDTLFIYLVHITVLYYAFRYTILQITDGQGILFDKPVVRYYVVALPLAIGLMWLFHKLSLLVAKNRILSKFLLGK